MENRVEIASGLVKEELHGGRIIILRINSVSRETIDMAYETVTEIHHRCGDDLPFLLVYDVTPKNMTITPYIRTLSSRLNAVNPHVRGRVAVVLPKSPTTAIMKLFVAFLPSPNRPKRVFFSLDEAVRWLEELL